MIRGLTYLVAFQFVGEVVARVLDLPVPGAVLGMLLCFGVLRWRRTDDEAPIVRAGTAMLRHLQLLFVPAGVGIVAYLSTLGRDAAPIAVSLVGSWLLAVAAVGWTAVALDRLGRRSRTTPAGPSA